MVTVLLLSSNYTSLVYFESNYAKQGNAKYNGIF